MILSLIPAHPRVGGENERRRRDSIPHPGSSPRGRGKPTLVVMYFTLCGLIPAWAGKTRSPTRQAARSPAHPRVGGENVVAGLRYVGRRGSSPRGRGKPSSALRCRRRSRLIPAWAGKTACRGARGRGRRAHPRVGGENRYLHVLDNAEYGSSPRGRGKPDRSDRGRYWRGLIPAWAGKTIVARLV